MGVERITREGEACENMGNGEMETGRRAMTKKAYIVYGGGPKKGPRKLQLALEGRLDLES